MSTTTDQTSSRSERIRELLTADPKAPAAGIAATLQAEGIPCSPALIYQVRRGLLGKTEKAKTVPKLKLPKAKPGTLGGILRPAGPLKAKKAVGRPKGAKNKPKGKAVTVTTRVDKEPKDVILVRAADGIVSMLEGPARVVFMAKRLADECGSYTAAGELLAVLANGTATK
jgi:hypothetical protein